MVIFHRCLGTHTYIKKNFVDFFKHLETTKIATKHLDQ